MSDVHIITGAAGDIALATMAALPAGIVLACDRDLERLDERVDSVRTSGREIHTVACDITGRPACDTLYARASALGRPSSLINLAGLAPPHDPSLIYAVNLGGLINLLEA